MFYKHYTLQESRTIYMNPSLHDDLTKPQEETRFFVRGFRGIWIPREIYLHSQLSALAKMLWAEIHFLEDDERGGCFASNAHFSKFLGVSIRQVTRLITDLKLNDLVKEVSYDGKVRTLKTQHLKPFSVDDVSIGSRQICLEGHDKFVYSPIIIENKSIGDIIAKNNKFSSFQNSRNEPKLPKLKPFHKSYGNNPQAFQYVQLRDDEYQSLKVLMGEEVLKELIERMNDYIPNAQPNGYKDYAAALRNWYRREKKEKVKSYITQSSKRDAMQDRLMTEHLARNDIDSMVKSYD
jgi:hypothetical protein